MSSASIIPQFSVRRSNGSDHWLVTLVNCGREIRLRSDHTGAFAGAVLEQAKPWPKLPISLYPS
jgi:hypothetical protein